MNNNKIEKEKLTSDPCLQFFHSGANFEGYWNSSHTKLQLEDTMNVLTEVYPDHDFLFLFDQSSGHTKMREDGLDINKMNVAYTANFLCLFYHRFLCFTLLFYQSFVFH